MNSLKVPTRRVVRGVLGKWQNKLGKLGNPAQVEPVGARLWPASQRANWQRRLATFGKQRPTALEFTEGLQGQQAAPAEPGMRKEPFGSRQ